MSQHPGPTLAQIGEAGLLGEIFARLDAAARPGTGTDVLVGPGDDTAYLRTSGAVLATTDTMVRGRDWLDRWSSPSDVGGKVVAQNLADLAAMGGVGTGLLVTLVAPGDLPVRWATDFADGLVAAAARAGVPVLGGDLSSSEGAVIVSVTALGEVPGQGAVLRSGAVAGQVLAVSGPLGRSAAGLQLLRRGDDDRWPSPEVAQRAAQLVGYHCCPDPDLTQGPIAAAAGATAMIDVSDGLVRDGGRIAKASGVRIELDADALTALAEPLAQVLGAQSALDCVLSGGEEHVLLATMEAGAVPPGWTTIGTVTAAQGGPGPGVWWRGEQATGGGWDHFGG
ncbi:MAG: thiamine-phosphate kinase [Ornithinimicrobium sp.]|uniref:thiamine-phosphate kinase n=1 Tax=Ornithinimicrobium sp. TaxID=1977084 RepID=UPI00184B5F6E|nr:thiamine-phosphate kinase [Actinomycetota bacterium]